MSIIRVMSLPIAETVATVANAPSWTMNKNGTKFDQLTLAKFSREGKELDILRRIADAIWTVLSRGFVWFESSKQTLTFITCPLYYQPATTHGPFYSS